MILIKQLAIAFPVIPCITSPMPIGFIPEFSQISIGMSLDANNASSLSGMAMRFATSLVLVTFLIQQHL